MSVSTLNHLAPHPRSSWSVDDETSTSTVRVASLLPFITDIVHELKLSHLLVAVSHECATQRCHNQCENVTQPKLDERHTKEMQEISSGWKQVTTYEHYVQQSTILNLFNDDDDDNETELEHLPISFHICSFYNINLKKLAKLRPTHILTHISTSSDEASPSSIFEPTQYEIIQTIKLLIPSVKKVLSLNATNLSQIYSLHHTISSTLLNSSFSPSPSIELITNARIMLNQVSKVSKVKAGKLKKVAVVQWLIPTFLTGGFVPELIHIVGGDLCSPMPNPNGHSKQIAPHQLFLFDYVLFVPCAFQLQHVKHLVDEYWDHSLKPIVSNHRSASPLPKFAICDGVRLFSWLGISNVVKSAQVLSEFMNDTSWFGHKGTLWREWKPPV